MSWSVFNLVAERDAVALCDRLAADHVVRVVDGAVRDGSELRARFADSLGFPADGWDSFADDVWNALLPDDDEGDRVALIWEHADALVESHLEDFLTAFEILLGVARAAYEQEIHVLLFLLGSGPSFTPLG